MSLLLEGEPREWLEIEISSRTHHRDGLVYEARIDINDPRVPEHGSLAGYAHVTPIEDGERTHLHMIAVNPSYDRRGVGRTLLAHLIEQAGGAEKVSYTGFTPEGAALWFLATGQAIEPTLSSGSRSNAGWRDA